MYVWLNQTNFFSNLSLNRRFRRRILNLILDIRIGPILIRVGIQKRVEFFENFAKRSRIVLLLLIAHHATFPIALVRLVDQFAYRLATVIEREAAAHAM